MDDSLNAQSIPSGASTQDFVEQNQHISSSSDNILQTSIDCNINNFHQDSQAVSDGNVEESGNASSATQAATNTEEPNRQQSEALVVSNEISQGNISDDAVRTSPMQSKQKYRGVYWSDDRKLWRARIKINGIREHLGYFPSVESAARAYDKRASEAQRTKASLNFPDEHPLVSDPGTIPRDSDALTASPLNLQNHLPNSSTSLESGSKEENNTSQSFSRAKRESVRLKTKQKAPQINEASISNRQTNIENDTSSEDVCQPTIVNNLHPKQQQQQQQQHRNLEASTTENNATKPFAKPQRKISIGEIMKQDGSSIMPIPFNIDQPLQRTFLHSQVQNSSSSIQNRPLPSPASTTASTFSGLSSPNSFNWQFPLSLNPLLSSPLHQHHQQQQSILRQKQQLLILQQQKQLSNSFLSPSSGLMSPFFSQVQGQLQSPFGQSDLDNRSNLKRFHSDPSISLPSNEIQSFPNRNPQAISLPNIFGSIPSPYGSFLSSSQQVPFPTPISQDDEADFVEAKKSKPNKKRKTE